VEVDWQSGPPREIHRSSRAVSTWRWAVARIALLVALAACKPASRSAIEPCREPDRLGTGPADIARRRLPAATGRVLHVRADGSDAAACTARAPCRQIARAAPLLRAGDTLVVGAGDYARFTLAGARGRPGAPITIIASAPGAMVRGQPDCHRRDRACRDAILIERSEHVVVDGLGASGATRAGLAVELGREVAVRNGVFVDNGRWGIFSSFVDDLVIEHNQTARSRSEHGIYASNSGDRVVIRGNLVHDNRACGIQINADWSVKDPDDLYPGEVDGITTGALVEGNLIFANGRGGGAGINLDGVQDSVVRNNLLFDNTASGIVNYGDADGMEDMSKDDGDGRQGPRDMVIAHNTVVQPRGARAALLFRYSVGPNLVRNNILHHADGAAILVGGDDDVAYLDSDHNLITRVDVDGHVTDGGLVDLGAWSARGVDESSLTAPVERLFVAPGCDFSLAPGSPARNRGALVDKAGDRDLTGRPRGRAPDLGALEAP
jgi:Right handed beta helix region